MLFNSWQFLLLFLPSTLILFYLPVLRNYQWLVLILAGFIFYAMNHIEFLCLLIVSVILNAVCSFMIGRVDRHLNKVIVAGSGVLANLSLLCFFKYGGLIYKTFFSWDLSGEWILTIPLPIGISFYTFQGISLLFDTLQNNKLKECLEHLSFREHFVKTVFFLSFFPHSLAGPIVKSHYFFPQIGLKKFEDIKIVYALKLLILGYFFKIVIADNIQNYTSYIQYPVFIEMGSIQLFTMMIGYSIQIFADFAGYSLIAIGVAALFGYSLPSNFNFPYISQSFREFWQRWHMSLSMWLREYLYFPLGGSRRGKFRTYFNLFIVMLLGGLWHGAAWNYLIWGGVHGCLLALERGLFNPREWDNDQRILLRIVRTVIVFLIVSWAWLFFKLSNMNDAFLYSYLIVHQAINGNVGGHTLPILYILIYGMPVALYHIGYKLNVTGFESWKKVEPMVYALMLLLIFINGGTSNAFVYFQF